MGAGSEEHASCLGDTLTASSASQNAASESAADPSLPTSTEPPTKTSVDEAEKGSGLPTSTQDAVDKTEGVKPEDKDETANQDGKIASRANSVYEERSRRSSATYSLRPFPGAQRGNDEKVADYLKRTWLCEVQRATMQDWKTLNRSGLKWPRPIIQAFYRKGGQTNTKVLSNENCEPEAVTERLAAPGVLGELRDLQRICINSEFIIEELGLMSAIPTTQNTTLLISPPYKVLMGPFPDIGNRLVELKAEMDNPNAKAPANENEPEASTQNISSPTNERAQDEISTSAKDIKPEQGVVTQEKETENQDTEVATDFDVDARDLAVARYTHLKALHDFIKEDLADVLELRSKIADGTLQSIHFEDLWHLFKPGDVIYSTEDGRDQLWKVYFTTGGQSLKRPRTTAEITEINNLRDKIRYWTPPPVGGREEDDEEIVEKMLREEGSGIGTWTPFKVDCYRFSFDGDRCGPTDTCKKIQAYEGKREITSLRMFPLSFHPNKDELFRAMVERGRKYLFSGGHKSYDGRTISRLRGESEVEIQSDVYVDFDAFFQDFPINKPALGRILRSRQNFAEVDESVAPDPTRYRLLSGHEVDVKVSDDFLNMNRLSLEPFKPKEDKIGEDILCLMPHFVFGYAFQLRKWYNLEIDLVKDIDRESASARATAFDDLVISKRYRDLLVALVDSHASGLQRGKEKSRNTSTPMQPQIDLVRGKGQGLIILLHGPPGSGKTSTAETIAAYTRRPLYSITCGDIGIEPEEVEKNLLEHTRRADRWGCVLLLDEADVFLVQRDWSNMRRNALTSIFLRQLEYYAGILFLTTNRPGVIDEAFKSRVHISLRYPGVDLESTKRQWSNILNRLEADNKTAEVKVVFDKEALLDFAQRHFDKCNREGVTWNGRQIRNAFQTALALGHYERLERIREAGMTPDEALATGKKKWRTVKLTKANFSNIAKTAREFEQYIETLRGSDSVNARESEVRHDEFDPERPRARKQYPAVGSTREAVRELHANVGTTKTGVGKGKGKKSVKVEQPSSDDEEEDDDDEDAESEDISEQEDDE